MLVLLPSTVWSASLDDMSRDEFRRAGLERLSAEELAYLKAYLSGSVRESVTSATQQNSDRVEPQTGSEAAFGEEQLKRKVEKDVPEAITARINGEFRGWDGNTVFRLDNGQVWKQRVGGKYRSRKRQDPEIVIERGRFGYYLKLIESGRSVGVKRIR